ncbi:MAG: HAD-IIB family hydrolase, partial [Rhodovibrionaceae bacterium]
MDDSATPSAHRRRPQPLSAIPAARLAGVKIVLSDIDDTLTSDGRMTAAVYAALERLRDAGLLVIPVTGRPAGWCDMIARFWPVDAVIGENGSFYYRYDHGAKRLIRRYRQSEAERAENREKLAAIRDQVLAEVPGVAVAADQFCRDTDLAIDFCEDVPPVPRAAVDRVVEIFRSRGAEAKISSIHVNGWFGDHDKLTTSLLVAEELFGLSREALGDCAVYLGDSPNDAPMFAGIPLSIGVANVVDFLAELDSPPRYVT